MKTLLISLGLIALAGSASAFTRVYVAPRTVVINSPVCRPAVVCVLERPALYYAPSVVYHGRPVIVRGREEVRRPALIYRQVVGHPGYGR